MKRPAERGQALMELVLLLPLFAALLLALALLGRALQTRLAFTQTTRDFALALARDDATAGTPEAQQAQLLKRLAKEHGLPLGARLRHRLKPLPIPLPGLGGQEQASGDGEGAAGALQEIVASVLSGWELEVECEVPLSGLSAALLPGGLRFRESVALKTGPWKASVQMFFERMQTD